MPWVPAPSRPCSRPCPLSRLDQDIGAAKCQYTGCAAHPAPDNPHTQYRVLLSTPAPHSVRSIT